jgi:hypothetical protein
MTDDPVTFAEDSTVAPIGEENRMKAATSMVITTVTASR